MSWVTVIWSVVASACLTLAVVQGLVWWRRREASAHALFALSAVGTALLAATELWMMHSATVKVDWPILTNLRLDPFERTGSAGSLMYFDWFAYEFWGFVFVQQQVGKLAQTALDFPPMQAGASFNLSQLKAELDKKAASKAAQ